jgi:hypothetical protein
MLLMARLAASLVIATALGCTLVPVFLWADPPAANEAINGRLALQQAMQEARYYLQHGNDSKKAVDLLEAQLARANGNSEYIRLLREAYRARIRDLYLASQPAQADVFLDRLCVLEPSAANDPTLRPAPETPKKVEAPIAKEPEPKPASIFPDFGKLFKGTSKVAQAPAKAPVARGVAGEDPFDVSNQRELSSSPDNTSKAKQFIARADDEFKHKHYGIARNLYERAYELQPQSVAERKEQWGYCVLNDVAEQVNDNPTLPSTKLTELRQQAQSAMAMAPALSKAGQDALANIDVRLKSTASIAAPAVRHLGPNREGWQVSETANFRIFHKQDDAYAQKLAQVAERTRSEMSRKWFGNEAPVWQPHCELIVYSTGEEYRQMTGTKPFDSPGHAHVNADRSDASRVVARWLHMRYDSPNMVETVLPHETTHVVLAGQFGPFQVPRWADEGIAVLSEPAYKVQQHRQNVLRAHQQGGLFPLKELLVMDYPREPQRITAFYAQSVALVELLTSLRGPTVLVQFVRDGLREGYEVALQRHYQMSFAQLQQAWDTQVLGGQRLVAGN